MLSAAKPNTRTVIIFVLCKQSPKSSNLLIRIMFVDDTNLFYEHSNNILFKTVNDELINIKERFSAKKLSLNVGKTKFSLFHKSDKKIQHSFFSTNTKNKLSRYLKNQYDQISPCLIRREFIMEWTYKISWR